MARQCRTRTVVATVGVGVARRDPPGGGRGDTGGRAFVVGEVGTRPDMAACIVHLAVRHAVDVVEGLSIGFAVGSGMRLDN